MTNLVRAKPALLLLPLALLFTVVLYLLFDRAFQVSMPLGVLGAALDR